MNCAVRAADAGAVRSVEIIQTLMTTGHGSLNKRLFQLAKIHGGFGLHRAIDPMPSTLAINSTLGAAKIRQ